MNSFFEPVLAILAIAIPLGLAYAILTRQSGKTIRARGKSPESANNEKRDSR